MPPGVNVGPCGLSVGIGLSGFVGGLVGLAAWLKIGESLLGGTGGGTEVAAAGGLGGRTPFPPAAVLGGLVVAPLN